MSGRSGIVTGSYAKEKIHNYIKLNKKDVSEKGYPFKIWINDRYSEMYNEKEFDINLADRIKNDKIYSIDLDGQVIEVNTEYIITNDEEWNFHNQ